MKRIGIQICTVLLMLLWGGASLYGQYDRATITGTVSDPSGAVLPGVQVTVSNTDTGTNVTATSNEVGAFTIRALPVGNYTIDIDGAGFKNFHQSGISLIAAQVLNVNVQLTVGSQTETVQVVGMPILDTETSGVRMTLEESAIRDLPTNITGGRDPLNLALATVPTMAGTASRSGAQDQIRLAGSQTYSNQMYIDGVESTAGYQGGIATPGADALSEVQIATASTDAESGSASGGAFMFVLKSGTNQFHGSSFYFYQNEGLNSNGWQNNYFLSQCAPTNATCMKQYGRAEYRYNDFGGSAGGPIWKKHTFVFGNFERFSQANWSINATGGTMPTQKMLTGDFSEQLTGGTRTGTILASNGTPWINPCTGLAYQYGQIFDPQTQKIIGGATCATPFAGNIIPAGRLSAISQKVAGLYAKLYQSTPPIANKIYSNYPTNQSSPTVTNDRYDFKADHYFSQAHHLSGSFNLLRLTAPGWNNGTQYLAVASPLSSYWNGQHNATTIRLVDNYTITPNMLNNLAVGFSRDLALQVPNTTDTASIGFKSGSTSILPQIKYGPATNGVTYPFASLLTNQNTTFNAWHYQDTLSLQKGRHGLKFGGVFVAQGMNYLTGGDILSYTFQPNTGGPIDSNLTGWVGSGFASMMLGNVYNASMAVTNREYPRQKSFALFAVDDFKVNQKLTLNLGVRWEVNLPGHEAAGRWENFDLTQQNPNWAPYKGAWVFSKDSGTTFYTMNNLHQFGPHLGGAYQITSKLVARASYGIFYVPLSSLSNSGGAQFPANQTDISFGINQVNNTNAGTTAFQWDGGYPGVTVTPPQNNTATALGTANYTMSIDPHYLYLGWTQNFYVGAEYQMAKNLLLDVRYMGNKGSNLHDAGRSLYRTYPSFSSYQTLLLSGHFNDVINTPAKAATAGVPYPYAGYSGPAWAANAPYPQVASAGTTLSTFGDMNSNAVSAFNAFIVEVKARNTHGLYINYSYTMSKTTASQNGMNNYASNFTYPAQSPADWQDASHWVQGEGQLVKGYVTYDLPFGKNRPWLNNKKYLEYAVGGWKVSFNGTYDLTGAPLGLVASSYQLPNYFANQRANFANGATAYNLKHNFKKSRLNPVTPGAASNNDFSPTLFSATTSAAPFGNTPYSFTHWKWNSNPASENMSIIKRFGFAKEGRCTAVLHADFFNVFNRHYVSAPVLNQANANFGNVTSASGNRVGQLSARIEW